MQFGQRTVLIRAVGLLCVLFGQLETQARVVINEIMYHPPGDSDRLQYIELHNSGTEEVALEGWAFDDGISFAFPKGEVIEGGGFVVICRDLEAFKGHYGSQINAIGDFSGKLSHSGEKVRLVSGDGVIVDEIAYADRAPWPKSPDGYGASLERIVPSEEEASPNNWAGSKMPPVKEATGTPGRQNDAYSVAALPTVTRVEWAPQWPQPKEPVVVKIALAPDQAIKKVMLHYWVAMPGREGDESILRLEHSTTLAEGVIPGLDGGSLVRFQVRVVDEGGAERVLPSPDSVRPAFSYYVGERLATDEIGHGQLINVGRPERGVDKFHTDHGGRSSEPSRGRGAFVYYPPDGGDATLYDFIRVTRRGGGFKLRFHSDAKHDGTSVLNVLYEGKPRYLLSEFLSFELFRALGVPTPKAGHIRFTIDGRRSGYFLTVEQPNRSFLKRNERDASGNLYKVLWFGRGVTDKHEKKTNRHEGHDDVVQTVRNLRSLKGADQWNYIREHFNVAEFASYYAANMCLSNWDGFFNNHYVYHDVGDSGRWEVYPWDEDKTWGDYDGAPGDYAWYDFPLTSGMEGDRAPSRLFSFFNRGPFGGTAWWRPPGYFSGPLLANASFRRLFLARLESACHETFSEPSFLPVIDGLEKRLLPEVRHRARIRGRNPSSAERQFRADIESFRRQLKHRRTFMLKELARLR